MGKVIETVVDIVVSLGEFHRCIQIQTAYLLEPVGNALDMFGEFGQDVAGGFLVDLFQCDAVAGILGDGHQGVEAGLQGNLKAEDTVSLLLADLLAVQEQRYFVLIGVDLDLDGLTGALGVAAAHNVHHRLLEPVCLIEVEALLAGLAVDGDQTLVVAAADAALVTGCAAEVEHIPDMGGPDPGAILKDLRHMLVIEGLVLLAVILALRVAAVPVHDALTAVFGHAKADVGVLGMELIQPRAVVLDLAAVPAKVVVVAFQIGDVVHGALGRGVGNMGDGGQAGRVKLLDQLLQVMMAIDQLLTDAADEDLIGDAPEHDGGVVVVLNDQLLHLLTAMLMGSVTGLEYADEGNLGPDGKAQLVAGIVEVLTVLIVGQTDRVGAQILDDLRVLIMILSGQGIALVQPVLMAGNAAQRGSHTVDGEAAVRGDRKAAHTGVEDDLVIGLIAAVQTGGDGVEVRLVHAPQHGLGDMQSDSRVARGAHGTGNLPAVGVLKDVLDGKVVTGVGDKGLHGEVRAAVLGRLGGDHDAGAAVIVQIKVGLGDADQVDTAVQAAVEGKVSGGRVHRGGVLVADLNADLIVTGNAEVGDVSAEAGVAALMGHGVPAVDAHGSLQGCGGDLNIQTAAGQRLGGRLEGAGVDCGGAQIAAVAVHAVYGVPGMGQVDGLGFTLTLGEAEGPALVEGIQVSHEKISFRCLP